MLAVLAMSGSACLATKMECESGAAAFMTDICAVGGVACRDKAVHHLLGRHMCHGIPEQCSSGAEILFAELVGKMMIQLSGPALVRPCT
jgi:hypothetical protein